MKIETIVENGITINTVTYETHDFRSLSEQENILKICYDCDQYEDSSCRSCGCIVSNLIGPKDKNCPINKW
jgi:predicted adenine nucleotide alpha hydrolase (AANH) superfamily ATPase